MHTRGVGRGRLRQQQMMRERMREAGAELREDRVKHSKEVLDKFRTYLEAFAVKYKNSIRSDPYFRSQFQTMCDKIGVDPLASSKGIWGEILGLGDFYYELGVQIIEVCIRTRDSNGGMIGVHELIRRLKQRSHSRGETTVDDVVRAVGKLKCLGNGFNVMRVGRKRQIMVLSVPLELDRDQSIVLDLAANPTGDSTGGVGCVTLEDLTAPPLSPSATAAAAAAARGGAPAGERSATGERSDSDEALSSAGQCVGLGWSEDRAKRALGSLMRSGMAWVDGEGPSRKFWFLSVWLDARVEEGVESHLNDGQDDDGGGKGGGGGGFGAVNSGAGAAAAETGEH